MAKFYSLEQIRNIELAANGDGSVSLAGAGSLVYTALVAVSAELSDADPPVAFTPLNFADLTEDHLAAAQRVRISATYGAVAFAYAPGAGAETFHPIAQDDMVILDGNANINNLYFKAPAGSSPTVAVTVEG